MNTDILEAMRVAKEAHTGQFRKYTDEHYVVHPVAVAGIVMSVTNDSNMISAAILHDVVEDTHVSIKDIGAQFNTIITGLVSALTDVSQPNDGNRATRKHMDLQHTAMASPDAKTIKLADLIDNTKSIVTFDKHFAKMYMKEKQKLLKVLTEGDKYLFHIASNLVEMYYMQIEDDLNLG